MHGNNLRNFGLKVTMPRSKILALFEKSDVRHLSAEDVQEMLSAQGIEIGLATVYRALTQFEDAGILVRRRFSVHSRKAVFEINDCEHHDHIICCKCGRVEEFVHPEMELLQEEIARAKGFVLKSYSLCLYCRCVDECSSK